MRTQGATNLGRTVVQSQGLLDIPRHNADCDVTPFASRFDVLSLSILANAVCVSSLHD
jgi:hypothetical protein